MAEQLSSSRCGGGTSEQQQWDELSRQRPTVDSNTGEQQQRRRRWERSSSNGVILCRGRDNDEGRSALDWLQITLSGDRSPNLAKFSLDLPEMVTGVPNLLPIRAVDCGRRLTILLFSLLFFFFVIVALSGGARRLRGEASSRRGLYSSEGASQIRSGEESRALEMGDWKAETECARGRKQRIRAVTQRQLSSRGGGGTPKQRWCSGMMGSSTAPEVRQISNLMSRTAVSGHLPRSGIGSVGSGHNGA